MMASPQPSFSDGSRLTHDEASNAFFTSSSTKPWKRTASVTPSRSAAGHQLVVPVAVTDHVQHEAGVPRTQHGHGLQRQLDPLVRHQPAEHDQARVVRALGIGPVPTTGSWPL